MQVKSLITERKRERERRRRYFFAGAGILALYLIGFGVAWIIMRSPLFHINHVVVQGNATVPSDAIVSLVEASTMPRSGAWSLKPFFGYGNILVWPSHVPSSTLSWLPELATLEVGKDYFSHTITITVTERQPFVIWCYMPKANGDEQCFWMDDEGTLFARAYDTEGSAIFSVHDYYDKPLGLNSKVLPDQFVGNFISIMNVLKSTRVNVSSITLSDLSLQEITVGTMNGPSLYFSLRFPADNYGQVIQSIMSQSDWSRLSYIDCRTENRVYYK